MKKNYTLPLLLAFASYANATIRNVPASYATIQAGLNACLNGDTVLVQPGTYTQNIAWPNIANIKLFSAGDSSSTIINGGGIGVVISMGSAQTDTNTIIRGFKLTNGYSNTTWSAASAVNITAGGVKLISCALCNNQCGGSATTWSYGGAIDVSSVCRLVMDGVTIRNNTSNSSGYAYGGGMQVQGNGSAWIRNSVINNNAATASNYCFGGGIYSQGMVNLSNVIIQNNTMNSGGYHFGGGICFRGGSGTLNRVWIIGNSILGSANYYFGGGIELESNANVSLTNVLIASNIISTTGSFFEGGGIYVDGSTLTGMQVTATDNHRQNNSTINGSGVYASTNASVTLTNSILYNVNGGQEISNNSSSVTINYSDVRGGYFGIGDINAIPGFVSATDFHLTGSSPCVNVGTTSGAPVNDLDNASRPMPVATNPDMGSYEVDQSLTSAQQLNSGEFGFDLFPNPASTVISVQFSTMPASHVRIELLDLTGSLVYQIPVTDQAADKLQINVSALSPGIYFIRVVNSEKSITRKFTKQ